MIYLDNAATTFPKPASVKMAIEQAMARLGANPGRGGYAMSMAAAREVYQCRVEVNEFFHGPGPENVVFPLNCTQALNLVLKGWLRPGDHVVVSDLEHNAVMRPLQALSGKGVTWTKAHVTPGDNDATVDAFRKALTGKTRLIVCTHASNVWGFRLPVERIGAMAREYGIPIALDCAQSAGVLPIDMEDMGVDFLCAAGHKGLYGPMGTGILIAAQGSKLSTILEGGTGNESRNLNQPAEMPEHLESGTVNVPGIAGLRAGIRFVRRQGEGLYRREMAYVQELYDRLAKIPEVILYTPRPEYGRCVPLLSCNVKGLSSEEAAAELAKWGIAVRAGLHCAPAAHETMGTLETGAIRMAPSGFSNIAEIPGVANGFLKMIHRKFAK